MLTSSTPFHSGFPPFSVLPVFCLLSNWALSLSLLPLLFCLPVSCRNTVHPPPLFGSVGQPVAGQPDWLKLSCHYVHKLSSCSGRVCVCVWRLLVLLITHPPTQSTAAIVAEEEAVLPFSCPSRLRVGRTATMAAPHLPFCLPACRKEVAVEELLVVVDIQMHRMNYLLLPSPLLVRVRCLIMSDITQIMSLSRRD